MLANQIDAAWSAGNELGLGTKSPLKRCNQCRSTLPAEPATKRQKQFHDEHDDEYSRIQAAGTTLLPLGLCGKEGVPFHHRHCAVGLCLLCIHLFRLLFSGLFVFLLFWFLCGEPLSFLGSLRRLNGHFSPFDNCLFHPISSCSINHTHTHSLYSFSLTLGL